MFSPIIEEEVFKDLTERQKEILQFVGEYIEESGYPPTIREIGRRFGISSTKGVKVHLDALEKKGYLKRAGRGARALRVASYPPSSVRSLPILERIVAGFPLVSEENIESWVVLDSSLASREDCFLLRVRGRSMVEAGILDGDCVLVLPQEAAENGDIVVALVEDEATVRRYYRRGNKVELLPANKEIESLLVLADSVRLVGKVIGVLRTTM